MMTPKHITLIEEAVAANCNGHADCPVDHRSWSDIVEAVRSIVESGGRLAGEDEVVVKRTEIEATANILERAGRPDVARVVRDW